MSLLEESSCLLRDGQQPSRKAHYGINVRRETSGDFVAFALDLVELPRRDRVLYTWSHGIDPDLDEVQQLYGLIQKAILELDTTLGRWQIRVGSIEGQKGAMPRVAVGWTLMKELVESRSGKAWMGMSAPRGMSEPPSYDHVLAQLRDVDNFYLSCSPLVRPSGAWVYA